jgi:Ni,Fe-hydrogenase I cytochrome b subunit
MGEDLKDEREKGHVEFKDHLHQDAHHSFSILSTMLKNGGGHAAVHYEHQKGRYLTLNFIFVHLLLNA